MTMFLLVLHVIVSFVLIGVILLQAGKGGGLSETFGGASQQLFGTKSSAFLNRATAVCAVMFLVTCLSLGILSGRGRRSLLETVQPQTSPAVVQTDEVPIVEGVDEQLPPEEAAEPFPDIP